MEIIYYHKPFSKKKWDKLVDHVLFLWRSHFTNRVIAASSYCEKTVYLTLHRI